MWGYIAACVAVPGIWGGIAAWLFSRGDKKAKTAAQHPPVDYMI
jgi:hypothetical protein